MNARIPIIILLGVLIYSSSGGQVKKTPVKKATVPTKKVADKKITAKTTTAQKNTATKTPAKTITPAKNITPVNSNNIKVATVPLLQYKDIPVDPLISIRERDMINEINKVRSNPPGYVPLIESYLQRTDADPETRSAAEELIALLKGMKPMNLLSLDHTMYSSAKQYGITMAKKNEFEHSLLPYAENLSLGYENVRDAIIDLLIDDDFDDRGHRKNLLNNNIKYIAIVELPGKIQDIAHCYLQEFK